MTEFRPLTPLPLSLPLLRPCLTYIWHSVQCIPRVGRVNRSQRVDLHVYYYSAYAKIAVSKINRERAKPNPAIYAYDIAFHLSTSKLNDRTPHHSFLERVSYKSAKDRKCLTRCTFEEHTVTPQPQSCFRPCRKFPPLRARLLSDRDSCGSP